MLDLVGQLENKLADNGALAFTFIDPNYTSWPGRYHGNNLVWRLEREIYLEGEKGNTLDIDVPRFADEAKDAKWFVLVNGEDLYLETEETRHYAPAQQRTYHMFYTVDYIRSLFPQATILPPVNDEMQHCCVIRSGEKRTSQEGRLAPRPSNSGGKPLFLTCSFQVNSCFPVNDEMQHCCVIRSGEKRTNQEGRLAP